MPIRELLETQLLPFATDGARYSLQGEDVVLTPNAALSLGLAAYELATNATKYGAFSTPAGHVAIEWRLNAPVEPRREFILWWKESGGPSVKAPTRRGFGSELLQRQLKYELSGHASMEFLDSGLVVTLAIPAKEILASMESTGAQE